MSIIVAVVTAVLSGLVTMWVTRTTLRKKEPELIANASKMAVEAMKDVLNSVKEEKNELATQLKQLKNETTRLRRAIEKIGVCPHAADCPVTAELQDNKKQRECKS